MLLSGIGVPASRRGGGGGPTLLVYDSFTEASNTALDLHTPDTDELGTGWTLTGAGFTVLGTDILSIGAGTQAAYFDPSSYSETITFCSSPGTNTFYLATRFIDYSNFWFTNWSSSQRIYEVTGGTSFLRAFQSAPFSANDELYISDDGETIRVGINQVEKTTYASTTHNTSRKTGIAQTTNSRSADNFYLMGGTIDPADHP